MDKLLKVAINEIGVKEIPGNNHNAQIIKYAQEAGFAFVNDDETPWCSIFVSWCAMKAELVRSKKASARSWLHIGQNTSNPEPGDVVVFWRESIHSWKGHVGIFMGFSKDQTRVYCLGGNQGNQVSITAYEASKVLGFRRLVNSVMFKFPNKNLKIGDTGENVKNLQDALKMVGIDCGTSDGIFGNKTKNAVKELQAREIGLQITGQFNKATREYLFSLLND